MDLLIPKDDQEYKSVQEKRFVHNEHEYPLSPWHIEMFDWFKEYLKEPILDVGTRNGLLLDELHNQGYKDVTGLELTDMADFAVSQGRNVIKGDIQKKTQWEDGYFHSIIATHVIEHCYDPESALKEIRRILNGYLYLAFPLQINVMNGEWLHMGHYSGFETVKIMSDLLSKNGFETIKSFDGGVWSQTIIAKTI